jgi:hypothetical protein
MRASLQSAPSSSTSAQSSQQLDQLAPLRVLGVAAHDLEAQVRTRDGPHHEDGLAHAEALHDLVAHEWCRSRSERENRRSPEVLRERAECQIRGPEVVTPFRDAVRLVDDEHRHRVLAEALAEARTGGPLGRDQEHLLVSLFDQRERLLALRSGERAVEPQRFHPHLAQLLELVADQRDEGGYDNRHPLEQQTRKLVGERLAATRRQHGEGVAALEHRADDLLLSRAEVAQSELAPQELEHLLAALIRYAPASPAPARASAPRLRTGSVRRLDLERGALGRLRGVARAGLRALRLGGPGASRAPPATAAWPGFLRLVVAIRVQRRPPPKGGPPQDGPIIGSKLSGAPCSCPASPPRERAGDRRLTHTAPFPLHCSPSPEPGST